MVNIFSIIYNTPIEELQAKAHNTGIIDQQIIRQKNEYLKFMGLNENATLTQVRDTYRKLALSFHSDKSSAGGSQEKFKALNKAHAFLVDFYNKTKPQYTTHQLQIYK